MTGTDPPSGSSRRAWHSPSPSMRWGMFMSDTTASGPWRMTALSASRPSPARTMSKPRNVWPLASARNASPSRGKQRRWRLGKGAECLCSRDYTGSMSSPPGKRSRFPTPPARDVVALVIVVLAIVFILQNRGTTTIRFLIPDISAPLWTALLISSLLGVALGMAISHRRRRPPMG